MQDLRVGSLNKERPANQSENGGEIPTPARQNFNIRPVPHWEAKTFIEKWHYSKRMPTGKNICYGLFHNSELYAVIVYGIGVNPYQAKFLKVEKVLEIKRMCRSEPSKNYPLSRFIALTTKFVTKENPTQAIVAFADPEQGHEGTVYNASGFARHGTTNAEWHLIDESGVKRHRRFAYRYSRRKGCSIDDARKELKLKRVQTLPKIRWVKYLK